LIAVYLTGEIKNPGVYWVEQGTILIRVVEMAGGLTPLAWAREINLALRVEDGMHVHVPRENESGGVLSSMKPGPSPTPGIVNINTANVETLMTLPGIGESTALDIIQYRTEQGGFSSIDDLMQVPGIKQARFDKIKGRITV
jgi:competence protein ComEA